MLEAAPWADSEPHYSWSNKAATLMNLPVFSTSVIDSRATLLHNYRGMKRISYPSAAS